SRTPQHRLLPPLDDRLRSLQRAFANELHRDFRVLLVEGFGGEFDPSLLFGAVNELQLYRGGGRRLHHGTAGGRSSRVAQGEEDDCPHRNEKADDNQHSGIQARTSGAVTFRVSSNAASS